jgi:DNA-binding MarR family transcriptional regulator
MEKIDLINEIIELQRKIDRERRLHRLDIWMNLPITMPQLKGLFFMSNQGSTSLGEPVTALGVTPTDTTGIIDSLMNQGLVSRTENPENRRMRLLRAWKRRNPASPVRLKERRRGHMSQVLARLSVDELAVLVQGLSALAKAIEAHEEAIEREYAEV